MGSRSGDQEWVAENQGPQDEDMQDAHEKLVEIRVTYFVKAKEVTMMLQSDDGDCNAYNQLQETNPESGRFSLTLPRRPPGRLAFFFIIDDDITVCENLEHLTTCEPSVNEVEVPDQEVFDLQCWNCPFVSRFANEASQYTQSSPSACTAIAMVAVRQMLERGAALDERAIANVLRDGGGIYDYVMQKVEKGGVEHLMPQEVMENWPAMASAMVYLGYQQREIEASSFDIMQDLAAWVGVTQEPIGACLTLRSMTVAVCFTAGGGIFMFDSHSERYNDGRPNGASCFVFRNVQQMQRFLQERFPMIDGVNDYMMNLCEINVYARHSVKSSETCRRMAKELFGTADLFDGTQDGTPEESAEEVLKQLSTNIATVQALVKNIGENAGHHAQTSFDLVQQTLFNGLVQLVFPTQGHLLDQATGKIHQLPANCPTFGQCQRQEEQFVDSLLQSDSLRSLEIVSQLRQSVVEQGQLLQIWEAMERVVAHPVETTSNPPSPTPNEPAVQLVSTAPRARPGLPTKDEGSSSQSDAADVAAASSSVSGPSSEAGGSHVQPSTVPEWTKGLTSAQEQQLALYEDF
ncbi:unnamed protein product [Ostreobium quekettii]|uniref:Uncharacterized protein n=1 Tax=Ostreobium quekettii TaxID=121088 RepID=A0A8S1J2K6_9CHLO|nr:unnamed protein product [Ostreobium quekettii]